MLVDILLLVARRTMPHVREPTYTDAYRNERPQSFNGLRSSCQPRVSYCMRNLQAPAVAISSSVEKGQLHLMCYVHPFSRAYSSL